MTGSPASLLERLAGSGGYAADLTVTEGLAPGEVLDGVELEACTVRAGGARGCGAARLHLHRLRVHRVQPQPGRPQRVAVQRLPVRRVHGAGGDLDQGGGGDPVGAAVGPRAVPARPGVVPGGHDRRLAPRGLLAARGRLRGRRRAAGRLRRFGPVRGGVRGHRPARGEPAGGGRLRVRPVREPGARPAGRGLRGGRACWPRWAWSSRTDPAVPTFSPDPGTFTFAPEHFRGEAEGSGAKRRCAQPGARRPGPRPSSTPLRGRSEKPRPVWSPSRCSTCTHTPVATSRATRKAVASVEEQRAARAPRRVLLAGRDLGPPGVATVPHRRVEAVHVERGGRVGIHAGTRTGTGTGVGRPATRDAVGELDRVEHRHPLVVPPDRVLARRGGRPPHHEPVRVDLDGQLPGERQLEDAVPPGADLAPPGADARGRVTVPLPVGEPHLQPDTALHGGVHGVLRPVHRPALQVEGERAPAPRRRASEAAEAVGGGLEHAASGAPASAPGPRGFEAGGPDAAGSGRRSDPSQTLDRPTPWIRI